MVGSPLQSWSEALCKPRLVSLQANLVLATFPVMKILPARHIIDAAVRAGTLGAGGQVIESSSGNFSLGLAIVCREAGINLHVVSDPAIDQRMQNRLHDLGASLTIITRAEHAGGYQKARLQAVDDFLSRNPEALWTRQYDNPLNPESYADFARQLRELLGERLIIVASVGSGGSSVGVARHLRERDPSTMLVGVDTFGSVLFGLPNGPRELRGLGNSIMPLNLDHSQFDEVHWLDAATGYGATRQLHRQHAVFGGPTSGASWWVACEVARRYPQRMVVAIGPDDGERYLDTVFSDAWMGQRGFACASSVTSPATCESLAQVALTQRWAMLDWKRRTLLEVAACDSLRSHLP